jgi:hypothetical protein
MKEEKNLVIAKQMLEIRNKKLDIYTINKLIIEKLLNCTTEVIYY